MFLEVTKTLTNQDHLNDYHQYLYSLLSLKDETNHSDIVQIDGIDYLKLKIINVLNLDFKNNQKPALIIKNRFKNILTLPSYPSIDDGVIL